MGKVGSGSMLPSMPSGTSPSNICSPGVDAVKKFTKVYPLSQGANPRRAKFVDVSGKAFNTIAAADFSFWEALNQLVQDEPTDTLGSS
jgi:hypothetical protein